MTVKKKRKPLEKSIGFTYLGKLNIACSCGQTSFAFNKKCKYCGKSPVYMMDEEQEQKFIASIAENETTDELIATLIIDKIKRNQQSFTIEAIEEKLILNKQTGMTVYRTEKGGTVLSYGFKKNEKKEELFEYSKDSISSILQKWFLYQKIHYVNVTDLLNQPYGMERCFIFLRFPSLQNFIFNQYSFIPEHFDSGLEKAKTGDDIWRVFTGHHSKKIKEYANTTERFNLATIFGSFIQQPENLYNLLFLFEERLEYYYGYSRYGMFEKRTHNQEDVFELFEQYNYREFQSGMKAIQNMHENETVWVNRIISHSKGFYRADAVIGCICDIGKMFHQTKDIVDISLLKEQKSLDELHVFLQRAFRKVSSPNQLIPYSKEEKKLEKIIGDYRFILARDTHELIDAGEDLHICVGSYGDAAVSKRVTIVLLYKNNEKIPVVCIEIRNKKIVQAKMARNRVPVGEAREMVINWASICNLTLYTADIATKELMDDVLENVAQRALQEAR